MQAAYFSSGYFRGSQKITIRDAREADLGSIHEIYGQQVSHGFATFEEVPPTICELSRRRRRICEQGLPYLVAVADSEVVGYAYAASYRPRPAYRKTVENSIYVAPGMQGCGIGKALLSELIARCEKGPWRQMVAVIGDSANSASIALHRSLGFRRVGTLANVGFKRGRFVDTVLMQRVLNETPDPITLGAYRTDTGP